MVGDVAATDLAWFENRPLFGRRIVVTRVRGRPATWSTGWPSWGRPSSRRRPSWSATRPTGDAGLRAAAARLGTYDWVVVTSPNGAGACWRPCAVGGDARSFGRGRLAAIGPGTADELAAGNLVADLVPPQFVAESLLEAFPAPPGLRRSPRAPPSRPAPATAGGRGGAGCCWPGRRSPATCCPRACGPRGGTSTWSRPTAPSPSRSTRPRPRAIGDAEVVTFTSSSTVTNFLDALRGAPTPVTPPPVVAAIGPVTAATARDAGLEVAVEAPVHTIDGLVGALVAWAADHPVRPDEHAA